MLDRLDASEPRSTADLLEAATPAAFEWQSIAGSARVEGRIGIAAQ
jgi:hypothetical protein